jgi:hypothetical protein
VNHDLGTSLLAVVRIVCVLGMSLAIAGGIFMLLGGWLLPGVLALVAFLPFFALMRYMEKLGIRSGWGVSDFPEE